MQKVLLLLSPNNTWIYIGLKTIGVKTFQSPAKLQQSVVVVCRAQQEPIRTLAINQLAFNAFAALIKFKYLEDDLRNLFYGVMSIELTFS